MHLAGESTRFAIKIVIHFQVYSSFLHIYEVLLMRKSKLFEQKDLEDVTFK